MAIDQRLIDEYARAQVAKQQYLSQGRKDLADNADRYIQSQLNPQMQKAGMSTDVDYSNAYRDKFGDALAGNYDSSQSGQVLRNRTPEMQTETPSRKDEYVNAMANNQLKNPYTSTIFEDPETGKKMIRSMDALKMLAGQFNHEQAFNAQEEQRGLDNRFRDKSFNTDTAMKLAQLYGTNITPASNVGNMFAQTKGTNPFAVTESNRNFAEQQRQFDARQQLDYSQLGQQAMNQDRGYGIDLARLNMDQQKLNAEMMPEQIDMNTEVQGLRNVVNQYKSSIDKTLASQNYIPGSKEYQSASTVAAQQAFNRIADDIRHDFARGSYTREQANLLLEELGRQTGLQIKPMQTPVGPPNLSGFKANQKGGETKKGGALSKESMVQLLKQAGASDKDIPGLLELTRRESSWNPTAQNPKSTAYGLFQFLDGTWKGYGAKKTSDPLLQTQAGLTYIKKRYGSIQNALAHHDKHNWY